MVAARIRKCRLFNFRQGVVIFSAFSALSIFSMSQYLSSSANNGGHKMRGNDGDGDHGVYNSLKSPPVPSYQCEHRLENNPSITTFYSSLPSPLHSGRTFGPEISDDSSDGVQEVPIHKVHGNGFHHDDGHDDHVHPSPDGNGVRLDPKILVFVETQYSPLGRQIIEVLEGARIKFRAEIAGKSLPLLTNLDKGKFAVIIFENLDKYIHMNKWNRELLDKYCREYRVGMIGFFPSTGRDEKPRSGIQLKGFPLQIDTRIPMSDYALNPSSPVLRIIRPGMVHQGPLPGNHWSAFRSNHSTYQSLSEAYHLQPVPIISSGSPGPVAINVSSSETIPSFNPSQSIPSPIGMMSYVMAINSTVGDVGIRKAFKNVPLMTVVQDKGLFDGIERVIFGSNFDFWVHKLLLLDSISFLSHGKISLPLKRFLLIDIDDIFVGEVGTRMKVPDVEALLSAQNRFQSLVPGFRFNLGFSGKYHHKGNPEEDAGDDQLIRNAHRFWWFCHMWSHSQPHLYNITVLESEMRLNKEFAQKHNIPTDSGYSIAPHHSGVYPVHEPLYDAWKSVWNVRVTSTEEYPHLRPARLRRGFIHRGIMVLPRQTCGLYTHTIFLDKYPGGAHKLEASVRGGELFYTFVYNPINIFMTHLSNYGNDRLALYTFENVIKFVQCWTNLQLVTLPPQPLAIKYFQMHPEESDPVWINPCSDKRHVAIWSANKSCDQLPKFLVVGPQKTGTTALYTFLSMHPAISSNHPSQDTFEEVQFFNGKNYYKGLDWYMNFFPPPHNSSHQYLFEKSATYFDGEAVPLRVHSLLPNSTIVTILISPIKRAYSWYQHVRAHRDVTALNYSFYEVITANEKSPRPLRELKHRCLNPGMYSQHLEHWISFFPPQHILIIDGEELRSDPATVMDRVQSSLKIEPYFDYRDHLKYDHKKGFFCQITNGNGTKCLGRGKGRAYPKMEPKAESFLRDFYTQPNVALSKLLTKLHQPIPLWLESDLSHV